MTTSGACRCAFPVPSESSTYEPEAETVATLSNVDRLAMRLPVEVAISALTMAELARLAVLRVPDDGIHRLVERRPTRTSSSTPAGRWADTAALKHVEVPSDISPSAGTDGAGSVARCGKEIGEQARRTSLSSPGSTPKRGCSGTGSSTSLSGRSPCSRSKTATTKSATSSSIRTMPTSTSDPARRRSSRPT